MDVFKFSCPGCGQHYSSPTSRVGAVGKCAKCNQRFRLDANGAVPLEGAAPPVAAPPSPPRPERRTVPDRRGGVERRREAAPPPAPGRRIGAERRIVADRRAAPVAGIRCPGCMEAVSDTDRECPSCRTALFKRCPYCKEEIRASAVKCRHCSEDLSPSAAPGGGRRDLRMEGHISAIALWFRVGPLAIVGLVMIATLSFGGGPSADALPVLILPIAILAGFYAVGHFLSRYANGARITAMILLGLWPVFQFLSISSMASRSNRYGGPESSFLCIQMAIVLAMALPPLIVLAMGKSAQICTEEYRRIVERSPGEKPFTYSSPFFYLPAGLLGLGILGLISNLSNMR